MNKIINVEIDRKTLPRDGQRVRFKDDREEWHEGYFVEGEDLFSFGENDFIFAWYVHEWEYLDEQPSSDKTYSEQDYWSLVGELKGTLRGIIDFYNPNTLVKESLEKRIKELEALKLNNPLYEQIVIAKNKIS